MSSQIAGEVVVYVLVKFTEGAVELPLVGSLDRAMVEEAYQSHTGIAYGERNDEGPTVGTVIGELRLTQFSGVLVK